VSARAGAAYLDSSALVKLVIPEPETQALRTELAGWSRQVTSGLARVEVIRACARVDSKAVPLAERVVDALDLLAVDEEVLIEAARARPSELRALDAIHLASATALGEALGVAVVYDERLSQAMKAAGITTVAPR
jgi:predicted nucleic acid-binding protein